MTNTISKLFIGEFELAQHGSSPSPRSPPTSGFSSGELNDGAGVKVAPVFANLAFESLSVKGKNFFSESEASLLNVHSSNYTRS